MKTIKLSKVIYFILAIILISILIIVYLNSKILKLNADIDSIEDRIGLGHPYNVSHDLRLRFANKVLKERENVLQIIPSGYPMRGRKITSKYGYRIHPLDKTKKFHSGIDFKAIEGSAIYATANGIVKIAKNSGKKNYGKHIIISHNYGFESLYAHMNKMNFKSGDAVYKGDLIGYSGNTGKSSGPHLHYEVRFSGKKLNPANFVNWNLKNYISIFNDEPKVSWDSVLNQIKLHELVSSKKIL